MVTWKGSEFSQTITSVCIYQTNKLKIKKGENSRKRLVYKYSHKKKMQIVENIWLKYYKLRYLEIEYKWSVSFFFINLQYARELRCWSFSFFSFFWWLFLFLFYDDTNKVANEKLKEKYQQQTITKGRALQFLLIPIFINEKTEYKMQIKIQTLLSFLPLSACLMLLGLKMYKSLVSFIFTIPFANTLFTINCQRYLDYNFPKNKFIRELYN